MAKIGESLGVDATTIYRWMKKFNIKSRSLSEASMKYPNLPFSGNVAEASYLLGLMGDLHARYHHLQVDVSLTTTHPAMIKLFENCFGKYGRVNKYPMLNTDRNYYEWHCYCYLHPSFGFLTRGRNLGDHILDEADLFYEYLSGLIDPEGFITVSRYRNKKQKQEYVRFLIGVSSTNLDLLNRVAEKLRSLGYTAKIREGKRSIKAFKGTKPLWDLRIERAPDVLRLMLKLELRHQEKSDWRDLVVEIARQGCVNWSRVANRVVAMRKKIEREVQLCKDKAEKMYMMKHSMSNKTISPKTVPKSTCRLTKI